MLPIFVCHTIFLAAREIPVQVHVFHVTSAHYSPSHSDQTKDTYVQ